MDSFLLALASMDFGFFLFISLGSAMAGEGRRVLLWWHRGDEVFTNWFSLKSQVLTAPILLLERTEGREGAMAFTGVSREGRRGVVFEIERVERGERRVLLGEHRSFMASRE